MEALARDKNGSMDLAEAQKEIARDWTQFLEIAKGWSAAHECHPDVRFLAGLGTVALRAATGTIPS